MPTEALKLPIEALELQIEALQLSTTITDWSTTYHLLYLIFVRFGKSSPSSSFVSETRRSSYQVAETQGHKHKSIVDDP
jgi:hypothetical protein